MIDGFLTLNQNSLIIRHDLRWLGLRKAHFTEHSPLPNHFSTQTSIGMIIGLGLTSGSTNLTFEETTTADAPESPQPSIVTESRPGRLDIPSEICIGTTSKNPISLTRKKYEPIIARPVQISQDTSFDEVDMFLRCAAQITSSQIHCKI